MGACHSNQRLLRISSRTFCTHHPLPIRSETAATEPTSLGESDVAYTMKIPDQWIKTSPNTAKLAPIYNIDADVGFNCPNRPDDVLLVQWLINVWGGPWYFGKADDGFGRAYTNTSSITGLEFFLPKMTGRFDGVTVTWIMMFQMIKSKYSSKHDGKMSPVLLSTSPARPNEILLLNADQKWYLSKNIVLAANPPAALRPALQVVR
jgi:hypothetical protein